MHFRVRRSKKHHPKHDIFVVGINKEEEEADPKIQRLWDDEQLQAEKAMQRESQSFNQNTLFYMKSSKSTTVLTNFIAEFVDLNCKYMFVVSDGVGQWLYESGFVSDALQEGELGAGVISIQHKDFFEALVPVTAQMHNNLVCLLQGVGGVSDWALCHQPKSHNHQLINISLGLDYHRNGRNLEDQYLPNMGYTTYLVCWNARLVDFFDAFCGGKTHKKDEILLTHILPDRTYGKAGGFRVGNTYSYHKARIEQVLMADVGWRVHGDGRIWVMPS